MITNDKVIEIFCATDDFSKKFDKEMENIPLFGSDGRFAAGVQPPLQVPTWTMVIRGYARCSARKSTKSSLLTEDTSHPHSSMRFFADGVHLLTGVRSNMKNKLMPLRNNIMLRKRYVIGCINHLLWGQGKPRTFRHRSVGNFIMNLIAVLRVYCFYDNKPEAIQGYRIDDTK